MDDQGEKIVFLAREILNGGALAPEKKKSHLEITMTFKTLCLTALLSASSGAALSNFYHEGERPLTHAEKTEINALVFYASRLKGLDEYDLRREVGKQIGLSDINDMTVEQFPVARLYLQQKAQ